MLLTILLTLGVYTKGTCFKMGDFTTIKIEAVTEERYVISYVTIGAAGTLKPKIAEFEQLIRDSKAVIYKCEEDL